ncbi:MAG TPA: FAD-binding protein, partial [Ktedonobacterales bacterium]|nr:FAD-binding protein [Ktedonobacterales bacterium]
GLAAPVGLDDDPELQLRDTIAAGAGLVDEAATRAMLGEAREAVAWLIAQGAEFDRRRDHSADERPAQMSGLLPEPEDEDTLATRYDLTLEAAHSRRRVLHAHGDATGAEIERALVARVVARPNITLYERTLALDLVVEDGACVGVDALVNVAGVAGAPTRDSALARLYASRGVILANGGAGRLWLRTSNPAGATADGMALAYRAGATLADLEFAQFHPTVLVPPDETGEPFLVSEAARGEGAYLRNQAGERFMPRYHPDAELAPRDVVARAILSEMLVADAPYVYLDMRHLPAEKVYHHFPTITAACQRYHLDLAHDLIPVAPAAHYFMGGVAVDAWARTTLPGLYAVGEVACTGVHGANRLASNSLLEGLVFGRRLARSLSSVTSLPQPQRGGGVGGGASWPTQSALPGEWIAFDAPITPDMQIDTPIKAPVRQAIQRIMWEYVSLRRDDAGLEAALSELRGLAARETCDPVTANMLLVAQLITTAALARSESRGGHFRSDYPQRDSAQDGRHTLLHGRTAALDSEEAIHASV